MLKNKSIFIGGIWHETNTFSNKKTYIKDFKSYQWLENKNLIKQSNNTNTEIGGFLDIFDQKGFKVVPSLFAAAVPSGIVTKKTFLKIVKKIISYLNKDQIDGVALALHGALVVENIRLPEYFLINEIKTLRERIIEEQGQYKVLNTNITFSKVEILKELENTGKF